MRHAVDVFDHDAITWIVDDLPHEAALDLDEIHRQVFQVHEGRKTAAKIVQCHLDAGTTQLLDTART